MWLDKACIDQQNIEQSLAALPLYLAGCNRLVVVAGPTYQDRLWCVIEVFTFLRMGGTLDRIDVLPVGEGTRAQVEARFNTFDAQTAQCFDEGDQHRLLGVIEAAFGDFGELTHHLTPPHPTSPRPTRPPPPPPPPPPPNGRHPA